MIQRVSIKKERTMRKKIFKKTVGLQKSGGVVQIAVLERTLKSVANAKIRGGEDSSHQKQ